MPKSKIYSAQVTRRSAFHEIRGVKYHVSEWGDVGNPLLVLLHGWGDCGESFQFLVDELQRDWFVIAPDWRGFGKSELRAAGYWFPDYIADLDQLLSIYSPDQAAALLGHSMGANIVGLYAGSIPDRVARVINVEGFGLQESDPDDAPANYRRWIEKSRRQPAYKTYDDFESLASKILQRSPSMGSDKALYIAQCWAKRGADGLVEIRADAAHKLPNAIQYRRAEAKACWAKITAPVLQVIGENTDFRDAAKAWMEPDEGRTDYPGAELKIIPDAGHMVHFEQPGALAAAIEAFMHGR